MTRLAHYAAVFVIVFVIACVVTDVPPHHFKDLSNETRCH